MMYFPKTTKPLEENLNGTETSFARRSDDIFSENDEAVGGKLRGHGDKWYVR